MAADARDPRGFSSRMDPEYFERVAADAVARHAALASALDDEHPVRVHVEAGAADVFEITIVALDHFSLLSILCGVLASFGLDIVSGDIFTFGPGAGRQSGPRKVVDIFRVRAASTRPTAARLEAEMETLVRWLGAGRRDDARDLVTRRLAETLERTAPPASGLRASVEVRFDNDSDPRWTVIDVRSPDVPGFLFSITNTLAARGFYIQRVRIESEGGSARDVFHVADRRGARITSPPEQEALRRAIVLTKQFTYVWPDAPDAAKASRHFDQLLDLVAETGGGGTLEALLSDGEGFMVLARLLGSSDFLWEDFLRVQWNDLAPLLRQWREHGLPSGEERRRALRSAAAAAATPDDGRLVVNRVKDRELFAIDVLHLLEPERGVEAFSAAVTDLAEAVLQATLDVCERELLTREGPPPRQARFAVLGLGKLGGRELGYASDLELLFVRDGEAAERHGRLAAAIRQSIEARADGIFRIDLRLRPYGSQGPEVSSLAQMDAYYREGGGADPFERQALVKLRPVAGDLELGRAVEKRRDAFTYGGAPWDRASAVHARERQARELVKPGEVNLKYSAGGLLDVEYAAQYLQIENGAEHPELRTPTTATALSRLEKAGFLSSSEHRALQEGYLFLRRAIEALRMVEGASQALLVPSEGSPERVSLARRLGYRGGDFHGSEVRFSEDLGRHMTEVRAFYDRRFGR